MTRLFLVAAFLVGVLCSALPALGQTRGEARLSFVQGADADFRYRGVTGGLGVLVRDRFGAEGDFGWVGDNSDEQTLAPVLSAGGTWRISRPGRLVPFLASGFMRFGDTGSWYGGGGALVRLSSRTALRLELRAAVPMATFGGCVPNERTVCSEGQTAVFLNAGLTFGFGR